MIDPDKLKKRAEEFERERNAPKAGGVIVQPSQEDIDRLHARIAELEKLPGDEELLALISYHEGKAKSYAHRAINHDGDRLRERFHRRAAETLRVLACANEELKERVGLMETYLKDTTEDLECLSGCDSYSHEIDCPVTNPMAAFRELRAQLVNLEKERDHLAMICDPGGDAAEIYALRENQAGLEVMLQKSRAQLAEKEQQLGRANEIIARLVPFADISQEDLDWAKDAFRQYKESG